MAFPDGSLTPIVSGSDPEKDDRRRRIGKPTLRTRN
jgi:hypothetical protein